MRYNYKWTQLSALYNRVNHTNVLLLINITHPDRMAAQTEMIKPYGYLDLKFGVCH